MILLLKSNDTLRHPAEFDNAIYFALPIKVYQQGELLESSGQIIKHTDQAVKIGEAYFLKWKCEFKVN